MKALHSFSGSYRPDDVIFLLKPIAMKPVDTLEKERRIQSGRSHYSEMIGEEKLPSDLYLSVFREAMDHNERKLALHVVALARILAERVSGGVTLVSLARAGTPVGALLKRTLSRFLGKEAVHYSISVIRDRGVDENALRHILDHEGRPAPSVVFVDGWTGKGVISRELKKAVGAFNARYGAGLSDDLYVLSDLCGHADCSPSCEDYLIPSGILNSTVSGLVSRSILNADHVGEDDFHGCVYYREFEAYDLSNWFLDRITACIEDLDRGPGIRNVEVRPVPHEVKRALRGRSEAFVRGAMEVHRVRNVNYVKPGIGEATRVLLRRVPDRLVVRSEDHPGVRHLLLLAQEKKVPVWIDADLPYNAAAFIQNLKL